MRKIGSLTSEAQARRFCSYLASIGIGSQPDQARDGNWEIWVHNDPQLEQASAEFRDFVENPADGRYSAGAKAATKQEQEQRAAEKRSRTKVIDARSQWGVLRNPALGQLTFALIMACVALFVLQNMDAKPGVERLLMFGSYEAWRRGLFMPEIRHGQVWRLFTPILLHGGIMHILFNMMWLRQLGSLIEYTEGSITFLLQVLTYALVSNVLQYVISGPRFYGMSGVVYGLFGFIWICARHDPRRAYGLDRDTVILMLIWFVLCFTGLLGPIANWAHLGGLLAGVVWGSFTSRTIPFTKIRF
jgi:GlpG protein